MKAKQNKQLAKYLDFLQTLLGHANKGETFGKSGICKATGVPHHAYWIAKDLLFFREMSSSSGKQLIVWIPTRSPLREDAVKLWEATKKETAAIKRKNVSRKDSKIRKALPVKVVVEKPPIVMGAIIEGYPPELLKDLLESNLLFLGMMPKSEMCDQVSKTIKNILKNVK